MIRRIWFELGTQCNLEYNAVGCRVPGDFCIPVSETLEELVVIVILVIVKVKGDRHIHLRAALVVMRIKVFAFGFRRKARIAPIHAIKTRNDEVRVMLKQSVH